MRPVFGLHRVYSGRIALGAVMLILALAAIAGVRASNAYALCPSSPVAGGTTATTCDLDSCAIVTNTVIDNSTVNGSIGAESHFVCNDGTSSIVSSQHLQEYIPLNNGWANVNSFGATDHDGEAYLEHYTPCFPTTPSGTTLKYRVQYTGDVTFTDGIHRTYVFTSAVRSIVNCDANFSG